MSVPKFKHCQVTDPDQFQKHLRSVLGWTELCHEVRNPGPQKPQIIRNEKHHLALFEQCLFSFQDLEGPTKVFGLNLMSTGTSVRKLPLWVASLFFFGSSLLVSCSSSSDAAFSCRASLGCLWTLGRLGPTLRLRVARLQNETAAEKKNLSIRKIGGKKVPLTQK